MPLDTAFISIIEKSLNIKVVSCTFKVGNAVNTLKKSNQKPDNICRVKAKAYSCVVGYKGETIGRKGAVVVRNAAALYVKSTEPRPVDEIKKSSAILGDINTGGRIDEVLNDITNALVATPYFTSAGIFLMNELLMELRGLVYAGCGDACGGFKFRSRKIRFSGKSALSDIIYFGRCGIIDLDEVHDWRGMSDCFSGRVFACPITDTSGKSIGVLIAAGSEYSDKAAASLSYYASLASVSLCSANMQSELLRLKTYEEDFDRVDYVSKDLVKMGMLAATVAHELKNPLVVIGGFARRLAGLSVDPVMNNYVTLIQSEVSRLEDLVNEILDYSRNIDLNIEKHKLIDVINETLKLLAEKISVGMVKVTIIISPELSVYVDKNKFIQVLINVIINAIQVMPGGGEIKITAEESPETIILHIKDTGGGIPDDETEKIFEPFHSSKQDGTGLGLSLCRKIMAAHGGHINAANDTDGAVFSLILTRLGGFDG